MLADTGTNVDHRVVVAVYRFTPPPIDPNQAYVEHDVAAEIIPIAYYNSAATQTQVELNVESMMIDAAGSAWFTPRTSGEPYVATAAATARRSWRATTGASPPWPRARRTPTAAARPWSGPSLPEASRTATHPPCSTEAVEGYEPSSYGEAMADVYDDWYADLTDVGATVAAIARLAAGGRVLELGTGTGRLAIPLAEAGLDVSGIDVSPAMVARLRAKPGGDRVAVVVGDMACAEDLPAGPFAVVLVAFNTFFGLTAAEDQARCFAAVAGRLTADGSFVVEGFVPDDELIEAGSKVEVRSLTAHRVVLTVSRHDAVTQRAEGQFVELTEEGGVRLRPWSLRYAPPEELDAMAAAAGLVLAERWSAWDGTPFTAASTHHVSRYRRVGSGPA